MQTEEKKPEIIVFAGPNGSGKSSTEFLKGENQSIFIGRMSSGIRFG